MANQPTYEELKKRVKELEQEIAAVRGSEHVYRQLFESNPHPMWIYDLETLSFLAVNNAAIHEYGFSRDEFLSMTIKDIRPKEDVDDLMENISAVTEGLDPAALCANVSETLTP